MHSPPFFHATAQSVPGEFRDRNTIQKIFAPLEAVPANPGYSDSAGGGAGNVAYGGGGSWSGGM
jgi:hypothetical protein